MKEKIIFTNGLIDLAQPRLGTKVIYKTDDFFASANRIISPTIPVFKEGALDQACTNCNPFNVPLVVLYHMSPSKGFDGSVATVSIKSPFMSLYIAIYLFKNN